MEDPVNVRGSPKESDEHDAFERSQAATPTLTPPAAKLAQLVSRNFLNWCIELYGAY